MLWSTRSVRLLRPAAIEARGLRAGGPIGRDGLRDLDLSVPVGARLLLVSRPEASARLLLRVLAGLVRPGAGRLALAGVAQDQDGGVGWAQRVGYVGPDPAIYPWLSPVEALSLSARLAGFERAEADARVRDAVRRFGLEADASRPMTRSGPMVAQKAALAAALITDPEVLLLDEPLRSVEPDERRRLLDLKPRRLTVIIASRYPASEQGLVNQLALIRDGRLAMHARVDDLVGAGLPLTGRGIETLAERRGRAAGDRGPAAPPAAPAGPA